MSRCRVEFERPSGSALGETEDVSARGAFVRTESLLAAGETTTVRLTLPTGELLVFIARVAHMLTPVAAAAMGRHPGMGISFIEGRSPSLVMLRAYLSTLRTERTGPVLPDRVAVVVADPSESMRARLSQGLAVAGFDVRAFASAADAFAACTEARPNLVIVAAELPGMSGLDLAYALADHDALSTLPVLMNGDDGGDLFRLEVYRAGVADFLPRPFLDEELVIRTRRLTQGSLFETNTPVPVSAAVMAVATAAAAPEASLRGKLKDVGLGTLLSLFEFERKSGVLQITRGVDTGKIHFAEGRMRRIEGGWGSAPRTRLMSLLDWDEATFEFQSGPVTAPDEVGVSVSSVLLEHAKRTDESAAGRARSRTGQLAAQAFDSGDDPGASGPRPVTATERTTLPPGGTDDADLEWSDLLDQRPDSDLG